MRIAQSGLFSLVLMLAGMLPAIAQDSPPASQPATPPAHSDAAPQTAAPSSPPAATNLNEVIDRMTQREHLFVAQMRHLHPMVETYLQDLRTDKDGNLNPAKDQYFLGRMAMSEGPEDTSFIGQPGFGKRMLGRLTGLYAMRFLPLGFAQMVVLDDDFQKRYYEFSFVRREFLEKFAASLSICSPERTLLRDDS